MLHRWKSETQLAQGGGGQRAAGEVSEGDELRRVNTLLRQENDILEKAAVILGTRPPGQLRQMIEEIHQATGHSIRRICSVLDLPGSTYYHAASPTPSQLSDRQVGKVIEEVFSRHRRRYGYRRIWHELRDRGIVCAPGRVRRIMAERGLVAIQPKTYVPRTSDGRADKPSPNLLPGKPLPNRPNQVWAGDITFVPTASGWLYPAIVIDLCSRRIVGWALADHMRADLVARALRQAIASRLSSARNLIFHSDRRSQYGSGSYRQILDRARIRQSMSARANPYHNAWTGSFMNTLKEEMLQGGSFIDDADARYLTPAQFEANILSLN